MIASTKSEQSQLAKLLVQRWQADSSPNWGWGPEQGFHCSGSSAGMDALAVAKPQIPAQLSNLGFIIRRD